MGFIDKIGESIVETGQEIRKMADQNSLQSDLRKKNKELESIVYRIGLEMISNEPEICEKKCPESYAQLIAAREQARILRNQIALMDVVITCPGCGRNIKGASQFCIYCGSRLPDSGIDQSQEYEIPNNIVNEHSQKTCSNCGAVLKKGASFCVNCGSPVQP